MTIGFCLGSLNKGGAERVVCNLANFLVKKNMNVVIIITKDSKVEYELDERVRIVVLDDGINKSKLFIRTIKRLKKLKSIIKKYNFDLLFAFLQEPIARVLLLKTFSRQVRKTPVIISIRIDPKTAFKNFKRKLSLLLYNNADGYVFQTKEAREFFNNKIQEKSIVIANSLNPDFYKTKDVKNKEKKIVSVGRLTTQKNYPLLINAFEQIEKDFPDYILEIYGDGYLKDELLNLIGEKRLSEKVILKGKVDNVKDNINNASLFIMTSNYEGMSNALMEALALGLPCISTDSAGGGAKSLIDNNVNGILIPIENEKILVEKMRYLLSNEKEAIKLGNEAKKSMEKYNPEIINELWYNYMMKIINKE